MAGDVCCTLVSSTRYCDLFGREKGSSETVKVQVTVSEAALALSFIRRRSRGSVPTLARIEIYGEPRAAGNMETEASARSIRGNNRCRLSGSETSGFPVAARVPLVSGFIVAFKCHCARCLMRSFVRGLCWNVEDRGAGSSPQRANAR